MVADSSFDGGGENANRSNGKDFPASFLAPKGQHVIARGIAPGTMRPGNKALKGRHSGGIFISPLQGSGHKRVDVQGVAPGCPMLARWAK